MSSTALQLVEKRQPDQELQRQVGALQLRTLEDFQTLGQVFVKSGFFADTKDAAQAIVKVMAGAELGFPAIASMAGVYVVKGKVSLSANLMASAIKRSGKYNYKVRKLDAGACEIEFFEGAESIGLSTFTMAEARAANLHQEWDRDKSQWKDKATWKNFPRNMLFARAMSNGAKWFCPDIFGGPIYTPDELGATVDGETGEVIEIAAERIEAVQPAQAAPVQTPAPPETVAPAQSKPSPAETAADSLTKDFVERIRSIIADQGKSQEWFSYHAKYVAGKDLAALAALLSRLEIAGSKKLIEEIEGPIFEALSKEGVSGKEAIEKIAQIAEGECGLEAMEYRTLVDVRDGLKAWLKHIETEATREPALVAPF